MKKIISLLVLFISTFVFSQTTGITYQAVIYNPDGNSLPGVNDTSSPLANRKICLQFSIVDTNLTTEYQETKTIQTDEFGMVNLVIGTGIQSGGYTTSFSAILWNIDQKVLKVSLDTTGSCSNFHEISNQLFTAVPFAFSSVNAQNVTGVVPIANGGTGGDTLIDAKTNLQIENIDNTSDLNKPISILTQLALGLKEDLANKSTNITTDGTSDSKYPSVKSVKTYVDASASTVATALTNEATTRAADDTMLTTNLATEATNRTAADLLKEDLANKSINVTTDGTSDSKYPSVKSVKTYVDASANAGATALANEAATRAADDTTLTTNLATETTNRTVADLLKEDLANKSINVTTDGASDSKYPSVKSVKTYVDASTATAATPDATTSAKGKIQLAGDLTGTANLPTIAENAVTTAKIKDANVTDAKIATGISASKVGLGNVNNTSDLDKPVSAATQATLDTKVDKVTGKQLSTEDYTTAEKTIVGNVTGNLNNKVDKVAGKSLLSDTEITRLGTLANYTHPANHDPNIITQDPNNRFVTDAEKAAWNAKQATLVSGTSIKTIEGQTLLESGNIDLSKTDVGLANVDNTSDSNKPVSTATQTALDLKANLASPALTGTPTAPTATAGTSTTQIATTAFVTAAASSSNFVTLTTAQTIAGVKTFSSDLLANSIKVGRGLGNIATNTAVGAGTLNTNITGYANTANGYQALYYNTTGSGNTANGSQALYSNTTGDHNTANGVSALYANTTGFANTANGSFALGYNTTGNSNTANGVNALLSNTTGNNNTANGSSALSSNTIGSANTANGEEALYNNTTGSSNTANGRLALYLNTTGYQNTANGANALSDNTTGTNNTALGYNTGKGITTGGNNTILGANVTGLAAALSSNIIIANGTGAIKAQHDGTNWTMAGNVTAPTFIGALTGNAATVTTNANLTGPITSVGNTTAIASQTGTGSTFAMSDSPALTGTPTAPTATAGTSTTQIATTAFVAATASSSNFVDLTTAQTIAGVKTFSSDLLANGLRVGRGLGNIATNTAVGTDVLNANTTGNSNTANGYKALYSNTTGTANTANGVNALYDNTIGTQNTAIGYNTGIGITTGNNNTILGANVTGLAAALSSNIIIANGTGAIKAQHDGTNWTMAGNVGIGTVSSPTSKLEVNGAATNTTAYNASAGTTIDFSISNLAYTTASPGTMTISNMKDGGTYTLAVQGTTSGTASFSGNNIAGTALTFKSANNGVTIAGKQTIYTFIVMGTTAYFYMSTGF